MVNKKILFLIFAGIFFVLLLNSFVGADWNQKVDWNEARFDWNSGWKYDWDRSTLPCANSDHSGYKTWGDGIASNNPNSYAYNKWVRYDCNGPSWHWEMDYVSDFPLTRICYDGDGDDYASGSNSGIGLSTENLCQKIESESCDNNDLVNPGVTEISDGIDNNCNGQIDEGFVCVNGATQSCGTNVGECQAGTQTCTNGQWSTCTGSIGPTTETCDGKDNNCDGLIDANNLDLIICYRDKDKDRFGMSSVEGSDNSAWFPKDACSSLDYDYCPRVTSNAYWDNYDASYRERWIDDWSSGTGDCDNDNSKIFPNAPEICDSIDNQCSGNTGYGQIDENPNTICQSNPPFASGQICHSGTCGTPRVYWASDSAGATEIITPPNLIAYPPTKTVYLVLEYPPFISGDREWKFEIYEKDYFLNPNDNIRVGEDALTGTITGNKIIATWTITQADIDKAKENFEDPFDFYFRMYDAEKPGGGGGGGVPLAEIILGLKKSITGKSITGFYTFKSIDQEENKYLKISWIEEGQTQPPTPTCTDGIKNQDETGIDCGGSICSACISQPLQIDCTQYLKCSDYTENDCGDDLCQVSSLDGCLWNSGTSSCNPYETIISEQGEEVACSYEEQITSTCETSNFLEYSLSLIEGSSEDCETKEPRSIICSAKTKLPLESKFGILLTILVIVLGYLFLRGEKNK